MAGKLEKFIDEAEVSLRPIEAMLAEFFNGAKKVKFIDFSKVEREAERYLSQYF
jgi:hypothetical protein